MNTVFQNLNCYMFISAYITMPSGDKAYPKIEDNKDGTVTVRYQPTQTGLHELNLSYNNEPIDGKKMLDLQYSAASLIRTPPFPC